MTQPKPLDFEQNQYTILVAGAAGFVPGHVAEFYLKAGHRVIGLDNFLTGTPSNIELLSRYANFEFVQTNLFEDPWENQISSLVKDRIDVVYSLASPASPIDFKTLPLEIMRVNSEGTRRLLEVALKHKAYFLEASTSEVYGDPEIHPQREDYRGQVNPIGPRSCYDESKRFAEALTMSYFRKYHLPTRIVRIFNTYGPRMRPDDGRVIPNFITQALRGDPLTIYGDGTQTRSYCFVDDLVRGLHTVLTRGDHMPCNVGNPLEYSILETAQEVIQQVGGESSLTYCPLPGDDPKRRRPDISRLKSFGFSPSISFQEGLGRTIEFFRSLESL